MFYREGKKKSSVEVKPLKDLTRIVSVATLLGHKKREVLLEQIKETLLLEPARFTSIGAALIHNLINYCQSLPETSNSYYAESGGLLDHALNRTEAALQVFKQYLILDEEAGYSEEQKLWQYALFSAAILQGIGKLLIDFSVGLYDAEGQFLKQWNPMQEALFGYSHYSHTFQKESDMDFRKRLNILLARTMMPASGYSWIASNTEVLAVWLALLHEDFYAAGTLGAVLIRADAIAIQRYFNLCLTKMHAQTTGPLRIGGLIGGADVNATESKIGMEFLQWFRESLSNGSIVLNKDFVLLVSGGIAMLEEVFRLFVSGHPNYIWQTARRGFLSLNLHQVNAEGNTLSRFEHQGTKKMLSGIFLSEDKFSILLPDEMQVQQGNKTHKISAANLIHQAKALSVDTTTTKAALLEKPLAGVNHAGKWQEISTEAVQASYGLGKTRG